MQEELHHRMLGIAKSHHLPELYANDLNDDLRILKVFEGCKFVWLLRTCGSTLVPVSVGADPAHVTHWLFSKHGQRVLAFVVDSAVGTIEKIDFEQAEALIQQCPLSITSFTSSETILRDVNAILTNGVNKGVWGCFERPSINVNDWISWSGYFRSSGNSVMLSLMDKAIKRLAEIPLERRKTAA